ncbi:MAG: MarR family transcriptional regulator [Lachnospiraceae bacterium]
MDKFVIGIEVTKLSYRIGRALEAEIMESVDETMSATTARIISFAIENHGKCDVYQKDIEHFLGLNRSSVSLILKSMEKNGFVVRESLPEDARFKRILPTKKAYRYHEKIIEAFERVEDKMKVGIEDLQKLEKMIAHINENLETK